MLLFHRKTKKWAKANILLVRKERIKGTSDDARFEFNWEEEKANEIFALLLISPETVVGLMALKDVPDELRLEITLLEVSIENVGKKKEYEGIAGCLIAYTCRLAFKRGYFGFVSLVPKTRLIKHYMATYGFQQYGRQLAVSLDDANALIEKYLEHEAD